MLIIYVKGKNERLTGVLAGVVHGRHPGRLLGASSFLETVVDHGCQRVLQVRLEHIGIQGVIQSDLFGFVHGI